VFFGTPHYDDLASGSGSHTREVGGFLCRWGLFALTVCGCVAIGWISLRVAQAAVGDVEFTMIVPDAIYYRQEDPQRLVWGYLQPPLSYYAPVLAVCHLEDGPLLLVEAGRGTLYPVVEATEPGDYRVTVTGTPYSAVAFQQETAILRIIPDGRRVFLVDAAMYLDAPDARQGELRGCLTEMRRRGELAFFDVGSSQQFLAHRIRLRHLHAESPLLWAPRELGDELATVHRAAGPIRTHCTVITDQSATATHAASAGFSTELISPVAEGVREIEGLRRHESISRLKEYLASQPIMP